MSLIFHFYFCNLIPYILSSRLHFYYIPFLLPTEVIPPFWGPFLSLPHVPLEHLTIRHAPLAQLGAFTSWRRKQHYRWRIYTRPHCVKSQQTILFTNQVTRHTSYGIRILGGKRRQERCIYSSRQTYGSNTVACATENSQRFLLATQETTAICERYQTR